MKGSYTDCIAYRLNSVGKDGSQYCVRLLTEISVRRHVAVQKPLHGPAVTPRVKVEAKESQNELDVFETGTLPTVEGTPIAIVVETTKEGRKTTVKIGR